MKKVVFFLATYTLFSACNHNDSNCCPVQNSKQYPPNGNSYQQNYSYEDESNPDWQLTLKVKKAIMTDSALSAGARFVSVTTTNGVVTLSGTVSTREEADRIVRLAKSVEGVRKVSNQITVSP